MELKKLFKNCLQIIETEEGLLPLRFSEKQLEEYAKNETYRIRSYCAAGVCLDVLTDASYIRFEYTIKDFVRNWLSFDIYINGIFVDRVASSSIYKGNYAFEYSIPSISGEANRVTIYFPHNVFLMVKNLDVPGDSILEITPGCSKSLLCLGDSITQGMDALNPSSTYPIILSRNLNMNVLNQGVGGYIFNANSLDSRITYDPDVVTIAYGTNDWNQSSSISELYDKCKEFMGRIRCIFPESVLFVVTPIWRKDLKRTTSAGTFEDVCQVIQQVCNDYDDIHVINGLELIPHSAHYFHDNVHPTNEGFVHMASNLSKLILPRL